MILRSTGPVGIRHESVINCILGTRWQYGVSLRFGGFLWPRHVRGDSLSPACFRENFAVLRDDFRKHVRGTCLAAHADKRIAVGAK
jgi:hypothetical protein